MKFARLLTALIVVLSPAVAPAQDAAKIPRVGLLSPHSAEPEGAVNIGAAAVRNGLRALGHVEGETVTLVMRHAAGDPGRLQAHAEALAADKVALIVAVGTDATRAAQRATKTIPIVMAAVGDPIAAGFVTNLARPGGNTTGTALLTPDLFDKQLQLLREAAPRIRVVGLLCKPRHARGVEGLQKAAAALGVSIIPACVETAPEVPGALERLRTAGTDSFIALSDPMLDDLHGLIAAFASRHGLPGIAHQPFFVQSGMLLSYGAELSELQTRAAFYVDRILKGANPAELPIEQAQSFTLAVNLKTAQALSISVPQTILLRAAEVVE